MHGFLGKKRHDVSSDISSFHSIEAHKQDGLYHWTTRASNSTVYKQYHSNPTDFENQMICPPNGPCREALVPQVGGSQEPWRPKASQEMVKRGFHFGRDAIQHGIRVCTKTWSIFIAEHLIYDKFSVIRVGILFGKKGIACHLHQLACILFSEETYTIHGIPIWQCGEKCKWEHPEIMIPSNTSCNMSRIYVYSIRSIYTVNTYAL